jgi:hypothetical protein
MPVRNLRVGDVFTDNAVQLKGVELPVWGTAAAGEKGENPLKCHWG